MTGYIEAYPVGLFLDIKRRRLRTGIRYVVEQARRRNWRAVRNYFNGYLAEWHYCPPGVAHTRCGKGWTKRRALRDLGRHIIDSNTVEAQR